MKQATPPLLLFPATTAGAFSCYSLGSRPSCHSHFARSTRAHSHRLDDKLFNADFLVGQFERLGVYDFLADDVYPAAVEEILEDPE